MAHIEPPAADQATGGVFDDLDRYVAIPRLVALAASPEGDRVVAEIAELDDDGGRYVSALWDLDPGAVGPARRLTRSEKGESAPVVAADGSVLFLSARPRPGGGADDRAAVWRLPAGGGEPWPVAWRPGAVTALAAARDGMTVVFAAKVAPGGGGDEADDHWHRQRAARRIGAVLHDGLPVREWDHERGPEEVHYFVGALPAGDQQTGLSGVRDLTPDAGQALHGATPVVRADGTTLVTAWEVVLPGGRTKADLVAIDLASGERTVLASSPDGAWSFEGLPSVSSHDGRVAVVARSVGTRTDPWEDGLWVVAGAGDPPRRIDLGSLWPGEVRWSADGHTLLVTGDRSGHHPLCLVDPDTSELQVLCPTGSWTRPVPAAGGVTYLLRSGISRPPTPARLDPGGAAVDLPAPGAVEGAGTVEEVTATAADGTSLRGWLVRPGTDTPAPLVVWVHGGPVSSWNDWSWRWNPWLMAAKGWAVLLPDPAFSTGYGYESLQRGWRQWGGNPYTDVLALTAAAEAHPDVDGTRTALMGGSYGGYMANWVAGHTDHFSAIVSHASIWSLQQFQPTTDLPSAWAEEFGRPDDDPDFYRTWSPDTYKAAITTPMLVIHGVNDYRCPVSESLRLWTDLQELGKVARYLSFPDENHWVLGPGDATVWYATVFAFLDHHVRGLPWERPALL